MRKISPRMRSRAVARPVQALSAAGGLVLCEPLDGLELEELVGADVRPRGELGFSGWRDRDVDAG